MTESVKTEYKILLLDTSFSIVAQFDSVTGLNYTKEINGIGSFSLSLDANDDRCDLFSLDSIVVIQRKVPSLDIDWTRDFVGLHRDPSYTLSEEGKYIFTSVGVGPNDFLARRVINYKAATTKSYKTCPSETAMKEYVEENCGASATTANEREQDGVISSFSIDTDLGSGVDWEGDKAYESLLDVLKEISLFSNIDFEVVLNDTMSGWVFKTYQNQMGSDRTTTGLDHSTGRNSYGNTPVIFSRKAGNIKSLKYTYERLSEANCITVLGDGDGSTRITVFRDVPSSWDDSIWNKREISRPQTGFISDMEKYGDSALVESAGKEIITISPLQQISCMYAIHFFLGDKITVNFKSEDFGRRIISVKNTVDQVENITFEISETPR